MPADLPDLPDHPSALYLRLDESTFQPTRHAQGAWNAHEQHMGPVSALVTECLMRHEPRPDLALARVTFEILGLLPAAPTRVEVRTVRPGRTIELVEATASAGGREVLRATAWRLQRSDTAAVAGGLPAPLPPVEQCSPWVPGDLWSGGFIATVQARLGPGHTPGGGQAWVRSSTTLLADEPVSPVADYLRVVDTANGMSTRLDPARYAFPNIDLSLHLYREPAPAPGGWVGFETLVTIGAGGVGLTSTTLHDGAGPVGRCEQILTVRRVG